MYNKWTPNYNMIRELYPGTGTNRKNKGLGENIINPWIPKVRI